jgi:NDP-sugar pyrophosphorylase family protein/aminoglycoside/choline kinase family phosphotransferase
MRLSAFILAAGRGERLIPITDHFPKPLLPVLGKPILESILEKISSLPISRIGINLHHKREVMTNWIRQSEFSKKVKLFPEDPVLGTGGALRNAAEFFENRTFLVHNADIISDIDLEELIKFHMSSGNLATLAVHDCHHFNKLVVDAENYLISLTPDLTPDNSHPELVSGSPEFSGNSKEEILKLVQNDRKSDTLSASGKKRHTAENILAFTGIAVYQPEFLQFLPDGTSGVVDAWLRAVSAGYKVGTWDASGCYWTDIGTPSSYTRAVFTELSEIGETVHIDPSVASCEEAEINGRVVIERDSRLHNIFLRNCLVLPGTVIGQVADDDSSPQCFLTLFWGTPRDSEDHRKGRKFENCILGPGFKIDLKESDLYERGDDNAFLIGTGGSDRRYYRVKRNESSEVFMKCSKDDPDFERHVNYTHFFRRYAVPVPELIDSDPVGKTAFFEDLGDLSLYSWLKCPRDQEQIENIYKKVLDMLVLLHTEATDHVKECPFLCNRTFDYEYLRWETSYFLERFVRDVKHIEVNNLSALDAEFHRLASRVDSFPKTIVHRDFQSQNIMFTQAGIPRILDYQGARIAPPAYDVVSILWDPYYRLGDDLRERLIDYYIHKIIPPQPPFKKGRGVSSTTESHIYGEELSPFTKGGLRGITEHEFRQTLLPCRLQRHMQALGAYGFLTMIKGKTYFMKYVPEGLRLLKEEVALAKDDYPELYGLVMKL